MNNTFIILLVLFAVVSMGATFAIPQANIAEGFNNAKCEKPTEMDGDCRILRRTWKVNILPKVLGNTTSQITNTSTNQQVLKLREEIIPLIKLSDFYDLSKGTREYTEGILIIATAYEKKIAILVDEIIGNRQFVIKALPEFLKDVKAVSGCSILGGGDVCLVIDTGAFITQVLE